MRLNAAVGGPPADAEDSERGPVGWRKQRRGLPTFEETDHFAPFASVEGVQLLQAHEGDIVARRVHDGPARFWHMLVQLGGVWPLVHEDRGTDGGGLGEKAASLPLTGAAHSLCRRNGSRTATRIKTAPHWALAGFPSPSTACLTVGALGVPL